MSIDAIVQIVRKGDADRFLATMAAPPDLRLRLFTLYAFNVEVARAPWASHEEMIAEMRLQFWRDIIEAIGAGRGAHQHELVTPLRQVIEDHALPVALFEQMIEARRWDIYKDPFRDVAHFERYIDRTSGNLMWLAALALGADEQAETAVRDYAYGVGIANWLAAVPELQARGRMPLLDGSGVALASLAEDALARMGRPDRQMMRLAAPALRSGWLARGVLKRVRVAPERMASGRLGASEFTRRGGLLLKAFSGRW